MLTETAAPTHLLKALHNAFSLTDPPMRILNHVVEPFVLTILDAGQDTAFCSGVTAQLVGDQDTGHILTTD